MDLIKLSKITDSVDADSIGQLLEDWYKGNSEWATLLREIPNCTAVSNIKDLVCSIIEEKGKVTDRDITEKLNSLPLKVKDSITYKLSDSVEPPYKKKVMYEGFNKIAKKTNSTIAAFLGRTK